MKYDFIGIREQEINGIKNPMLTIVGTLEKKNCKFLVLADNKEIPYKLDIVNNANDFALFANLDNVINEVEVYVIVNNRKYLISRLKSSKYRRYIHKIKMAVINFFKRIFRFIKGFFYTFYKGVRLAWREHHFLIPPTLWPKYWKALKAKIKGGFYTLYYNPFDSRDYNSWLKENPTILESKKLKYNPLFSIVIPVYNIERDFLCDCLDSILNQTYENFEVCIADDCSTKEETISTLKEYEAKDKRIKVVYRKENGHISKATNSAIKIAKGEFIALMDDDDIIPPNALYEVAKVLNENPDLDMIYTDEDKMEMDKTLCEPHFKPDFSPDTILGGNYICHFSFFRKTIIDKIGGFRTEFVGAQDFDLVLRFSEQTDKIYHIPKILYHWRKVPGSTAVTVDNKFYAIENGKKAVEDALKRRGLKGEVLIPTKKAPHYIINYNVKGNPLVSIIIPTKDEASMLKKCLDSIYRKTTYKNYEIIVINNQSQKEETLNLFRNYSKNHDNFRVIDADYDFNFAKMNNDAVKISKGKYVVLLNNDTEVITKNWLEIMLGYAELSHIGAVGVKLLYPDDTVQHGGVVLGIGGTASHAFLNLEKDHVGPYGRLLVPFNYSAVTAACLMINKSKYKEVDGLDENLKVAFNDVDFNIKLLKKGYYNIFLPQVQLYHYESKTRGYDNTSKKYKLFKQERKYMDDKWHYELTHDRFYNANFSLEKDFYLDKK